MRLKLIVSGPEKLTETDSTPIYLVTKGKGQLQRQRIHQEPYQTESSDFIELDLHLPDNLKVDDRRQSEAQKSIRPSLLLTSEQGRHQQVEADFSARTVN